MMLPGFRRSMTFDRGMICRTGPGQSPARMKPRTPKSTPNPVGVKPAPNPSRVFSTVRPLERTPMPRIDARLDELGIRLPDAPKPVAAYVPSVHAQGLIFISGQIPLKEGSLMATGTVPSETAVDQAVSAARQCAINALAVLKSSLEGDLDRVKRIVRIGVFVASDPGFTDQPLVANGASELMLEVFGDAGRHARAAVGSVALPLNASVEVELVAEVD